MTSAKEDIISKLKQEILLWEGFTPPQPGVSDAMGLGPIEAAFPNGLFPTGAIHEFLTAVPEDAATCGGFIAALLKTLMDNGSACLWISIGKNLFPPSLKTFGVDPGRFIFMDLKKEKDVLWAMEEGLKCEGLAAVIAELPEINFAQSRRLQLAVEKSKVTGFVLRSAPRRISATACVARWHITSLPSELEEGMPGVGFPRWKIELLKVRNGNPGCWTMEWFAGQFRAIHENTDRSLPAKRLKVG
jgi:protein ImuA